MAEAASEGAAPAAAPAPVAAPATNGHFDFATAKPTDILPGDFVVDYKGRATPAKDVPFFSESKTFKDLLSMSYDNHKAIADAAGKVRIPIKGAKPEEFAAFLDKFATDYPKEDAPNLKAALRKNGYLPAVPESADKYEFKPPEGREFDKAALGKVQKILHEGEVPQEVASKLMDAYFETTPDLGPIVAELKALVPALKQTKEDALTEYEAEVKGNGHDPEHVKAVTGRFMAKTYSQERIDLMGDYGSSPVVLDMAYKLALASGEDMGPINVAGAPEKATPEAEEANDIMYNTANPKHALWIGRGVESDRMRAYVSDLFRKSTGGK